MKLVNQLPLVLFSLAVAKSIVLKPSIEEVLGILVLGGVFVLHNLKLKQSKEQELVGKYEETKEQYESLKEELEKIKADLGNTKSFLNTSLKMNRGIK